MKFTIILLLFPFLTIGQTTISGKVINHKSKEAIAFATVGLMIENIGTNALEDGSFHLVSSNKLNDTLIVSCVGFSTFRIPVDIFNKGENIIELTEQQTVLADVVVTRKTTWTHKTLNDFSKCGNNFITSGGYQTQLAQHFQVSEENSILTEIKICRMSTAVVAPEKTIFRIRIYDIDTLKKSPSSDLCDQIIEIKTRSKTVSVNLKKYKIHIPKKDFFVAVEWLKIPYNESKSKLKVNGKEIEHITYSPSIGWTDNVNSKMEAWMLDYKNIWRPMFKMNNKTSVSISATVKY
jgi:hypothetical protein